MNELVRRIKEPMNKFWKRTVIFMTANAALFVAIQGFTEDVIGDADTLPEIIVTIAKFGKFVCMGFIFAGLLTTKDKNVEAVKEDIKEIVKEKVDEI